MWLIRGWSIVFVLELLLLRTPVTPKLYSSCILVVKSSTTCRLRLMWRPNGRASDLQMAKRYYLIGMSYSNEDTGLLAAAFFLQGARN
uniref:Secreted protein n=1 Tax=Aegilops tauschii subsp. strangulata TaxID=200361 RepID=A0A453FB10_AEGTS